MSTTTRVVRCIYRMNKDNGDFIRYLVRVAVSPTLKRDGTRNSFGGAVALRDQWIEERENLKKSETEKVHAPAFRQWGYL